ncbi:unnamed protein product [Arctogadus glacialis]
MKEVLHKPPNTSLLQSPDPSEPGSRGSWIQDLELGSSGEHTMMVRVSQPSLERTAVYCRGNSVKSVASVAAAKPKPQQPAHVQDQISCCFSTVQIRVRLLSQHLAEHNNQAATTRHVQGEIALVA